MTERVNYVKNLISRFDLPNSGSSSSEDVRSNDELPVNDFKPPIPPKPTARQSSFAALKARFSDQTNHHQYNEEKNSNGSQGQNEDTSSEDRSSLPGLNEEIQQENLEVKIKVDSPTDPEASSEKGNQHSEDDVDEPSENQLSNQSTLDCDSEQTEQSCQCPREHADSSCTEISTSSSDFSDDGNVNAQKEKNEVRETDDDKEEENEEKKSHKKRSPESVVKEILATERTFVEDLDSLKLLYDKMMEANEKEGLGLEKKITEVFSDFHQIYELHKTSFLPLMTEKYETEKGFWIGKFFKDKCYIVKTYKPFLIRQSENKNLLVDLINVPVIKALITNLSSERIKLGFDNIYNVVFQRITRYSLLLREYCEHLTEDCPDRQLAHEAMAYISSESSAANEIMRNVDDFNSILLSALDRIIDGRLIGLQPWEKFIREGPVFKISARRNERVQERYLFLFSGRLLVCYINLTGFKVSRNMEITTMEIKEIKDPDRHPNSFRIRSKERIIDLKFETQDLANEWSKELSKIIMEDRQRKQSFIHAGRMSENSHILGKQAPEWIKDEHCSMCMICYCKFSVINRKHHCRACGKIVCGPCSQYKHQLEFEDNEYKRVCKNCKQMLVHGKMTGAEQRSDSGQFMIEEMLGFSETNRQFRECYVQLHGEGSIYIKSKIKDVKPEKVIPIVGLTLTRWGEIERCFRLCHPSCEYYFTVGSEERMAIWIEKIQEVLNQFSG